MLTGHIMVKTHETQTNRHPNRDKILARYNHPRTSETFRRQDDVFGYKLQFMLFKVLAAMFQNLKYKLHRRPSNVLSIHQSRQKLLKTFGTLHKQCHRSMIGRGEPKARDTAGCCIRHPS